MHRILLREIVIDAPTSTVGATRDFWAAALAAEAQHDTRFPEFTALRHPAALSWVGLQDVGTADARYHLDIETDDVAAEVARLTGLGAERVADGRTWVVAGRDPSGHLFDVVPHQSPWFDDRSTVVE